jgi:diguanylate cyclase (GGDEF)-like protein
MNQKKKRYLHRKLAVSVFWAALLFAAFIAVASFFAEFKRASDKNHTMLAQLLDTVESTAAIAAYSGNRAIGEDVLKGLLRNDSVQEARLRTDQNLDLRQARGNAPPAQDEVVRALRSPFGDGEAIGTLSVVPDARYSLQEARHSALVSAFNSAGVIGLTALMLWILVRVSLSRPLMKVSDALHAIKAGEKERLDTLPQNRNDELGQLVHDINGLLDTVQEKFEDEHRLLRQIQAVEQQLRGIFENTSAGIFLLDGRGQLQTANRTLGRVLRLPGAEACTPLGWDFSGLAFAAPEQFHALMRQADERGQVVAADLQLRNPSASPAGGWVHCLLSRHADSEGAPCFEGVVYDITERRALEMRVRHEADHDPLTGLRRRQAVERDLAKLLDAPPDGEARHVVMLLDLDNFKGINDSHGHAAGDAVLVETARRLQSYVRSGDMVARLGGDEFVVVLVDCVPLDRAREIARKLVAAITQPIALGPQLEGRVGVSIGIAVHGEQHRTLAALFEAADLAMYEVKRQGKNGFAMAGPGGAVRVEKGGAGQAA